MASKTTRRAKGLSAQELREFRSKVSALKKKGLVSKRVDARKQAATRYMLAKVRKNTDVLEGRVLPLKTPKEIRDKYVSSGTYEARGSHLIIPKTREGQRARLTKEGFVETRGKISSRANGTVKEVVFPVDVKSMTDVTTFLRERTDDLNDMLVGDEQFGFTIYGHAAQVGLPAVDQVDGLLSYLESRYRQLFKGREDRKAFKHFTLFTYKGGREPPEIDGQTKYYTQKRKRRGINATGRSTSGTSRARWNEQVRQRQNASKTRYRKNETPEKKEKRLEKQRLRTARNKQGFYTRPDKRTRKDD